MSKKKDVVVFTGESERCLLGKDGKIVPLSDKRVASLTEDCKSLSLNMPNIIGDMQRTQKTGDIIAFLLFSNLKK